jgi:hypothetical protein
MAGEPQVPEEKPTQARAPSAVNRSEPNQLESDERFSLPPSIWADRAAALENRGRDKKKSILDSFLFLLIFLSFIGLISLVVAASRKNSASNAADGFSSGDETALAEPNLTSKQATQTAQWLAVTRTAEYYFGSGGTQVPGTAASLPYNEYGEIDRGARKVSLGPDATKFILIEELDDDYMECEAIHEDLKDFILETRFSLLNPGAKAWDFAILFRHGDGKYYSIVLTSAGDWYSGRFSDEGFHEVENAALFSAIDTDGSVDNRLRLIVRGSSGYLYINDRFAVQLDLSSLKQKGGIKICTGYFSNIDKGGLPIRVSDVKLWEIEP